VTINFRYTALYGRSLLNLQGSIPVQVLFEIRLPKHDQHNQAIDFKIKKKSQEMKKLFKRTNFRNKDKYTYFTMTVYEPKDSCCFKSNDFFSTECH